MAATASCGNLCAVHGCKSSKRRNKDLSFFSLPPDEERRKKWTELIGRPDLASPKTKIKSHFVCSLHFDPSVITYKPKLHPNTLPTISLPSGFEAMIIDETAETKTKDTSTQTEQSTVNMLSATNVEMKSQPTQTTRALSDNTPRKLKLREDLKLSNRRIRRLQYKLDRIKYEEQCEGAKSLKRSASRAEDEDTE